MEPIKDRGTFKTQDVTLLLSDITGAIAPLPTEEREKLIQSGIHYSAMLPLEYRPSEEYLAEYYLSLENFSQKTAESVVDVSNKIYAKKGGKVVLVSLARAGIPIGALIKRRLQKKFGITPPHYAISIVRGRGIDRVAMRYMLERHSAESIQFVDGWTGKGAILNELANAAGEFLGGIDKRELLAVLSDPADITDICGTREDFPIPSSFLNSTVCGLMSRTVIRSGIEEGEFHGVAFYEELRDEDKTYEFIERIESNMNCAQTTGLDEVKKIAAQFGIHDINLIKPGIGETTRVLLRRLPYMALIANDAEEKFVSHIIQLAKEKNVPVVRYPLLKYKACGIIKELAADA
ncbi:MAG: cysteine protease StiP family protein [Treponema sp.]|jgi:hypothetical protein|nr:cysteine protease StiP family protein [Treponema sp.]